MVKDGTYAERRLEQRLWEEQWATFRVAGSGTVGHPSADLVAVKNGYTYIFEVKSLNENSLPYDVSGDSEQLMEIVDRVEGQENCFVGFAIDFVGEDIWRYCDYVVSYIQNIQDTGKLYKILNEASE